MLNFVFHHNGFLSYISDEIVTPTNNEVVYNRNDIKTYAEACDIAAAASAVCDRRYMAADRGYGVSPRFDVIEAPHVGDPVSMTINGDYYPCGYITRVSTTGKRVETDTGEVFFQKMCGGRPTGKWGQGKSLGMVRGHHDVRNPHV